jgi:alkanesulfonate monooxygenase SsuD/methylene tetrahydromethanopterin reductase-like flavin-dependent oxidoreductase (luciferase family)
MATVSKRGVRLGVVILPDTPWDQAEPWWRQAEELGFAHAWTYDHLTWRGHRDKPWFGAMPTLTAAAMATTEIRLGPLVASPNFRHPLPFAKELMTLDDISGGRLTLGIGAGGSGWDATMLGHPPWSTIERADRFAEFVSLTDLLLTEPEPTSRGRFYSVDEARMYPGCVQRPRVPFAVAATGPRGMGIAARFAATWVTTGPRDGAGALAPAQGAAAVREQIIRLEQACDAIGRDPASIDRLVLTGITLSIAVDDGPAFTDALGAYADAGATDVVVHWPRDDDPFRADRSRFEDVMADLT